MEQRDDDKNSRKIKVKRTQPHTGADPGRSRSLPWTRPVLLGEAQATIEMANEAVRRMSGSRLEREARPSSEGVHHIVKAEVSALDTKVDALKAEVNDRLSALEAKVESKLDAIIARLSR